METNLLRRDRMLGLIGSCGREMKIRDSQRYLWPLMMRESFEELQVKDSAVQDGRFSLLMDPTDRWFIWDVLIDQPLTAKGDIISSTHHDEMAFVLGIFQEFHYLSAPRSPSKNI